MELQQENFINPSINTAELPSINTLAQQKLAPVYAKARLALTFSSSV